ncbi:MAG: hypothetical protein OXF06_01855, partial [Bacteroidetes bacterium]|nr:hypothetical protein [Bacteroidota bacterium]
NSSLNGTTGASTIWPDSGVLSHPAHNTDRSSSNLFQNMVLLLRFQYSSTLTLYRKITIFIVSIPDSNLEYSSQLLWMDSR